jgi:hypothetical protein
VHLSTHYYVLSLSEKANMLYECFRDNLIDVQDEKFPVDPSAFPDPVREESEDARLRNLMRSVDARFAHYYRQDPLRLVVVGEKRVWEVFEAITAHSSAIIGVAGGDYTATTPHDLGRIVWPFVREAISGMKDTMLHELEIAEKTQKLVCGLEDVGWHSDVQLGSTLLVEEDYHVRGTMKKLDQTLVVSPEVDIREVMDDMVDTVIEKVLQIGGSVIFMNPGSLKKQKRIALILSGAEVAP